MAVATLLMCLQSVFIVGSSAINAGCRCVEFDTTYGKDYGVFTSPNWPIPYDENINCLLYTFIGQEDELIEITFDEFDVQKSNIECRYVDYVKLYLHLTEPAVNEFSQENFILCGKLSDVETTHYSASQYLMFEFHSDWRRGNNTGFRGTFRFLSKSLFQTDGEPLQGSECEYQFLSGNGSHGNGRFYSPLYPSIYPKNILCAYHFMGVHSERVHLLFEYARLQSGDLSCLFNADKIVVHDGKDRHGTVIGEICNRASFMEVVSSGPDLYVEFISSSHFPGQGFRATYEFEKKHHNQGLNIPSTEPEKSDSTTSALTTQTPDQAHHMWISSDVSRNGTISSPNYPKPYTSNVHYSYSFSSRGKERVQIIFTDFDLFMPFTINRKCEGVDNLVAFININGERRWIDRFCGRTIPPQLMANGPFMTLEFQSLDSTTSARGFHAIYRFVTNFGINVGSQDNQSVCGYVFNSWETSNGSFTSPNYPGLYPRDSECHYFFYGRDTERVHISFTYFDVEGVTPCTMDTASDYVEFSNFRKVDMGVHRHCGIQKPKKIKSDGNFFRVTFKSNNRFDGTGFEAFYHFRNYVDPFTVKRVRGSAGAPMKCSNREQHIITFFFITEVFCVILHRVL
ncbi:suppressor of lurcher protein 1-like isoform X1 [Tachypleus tridentatus]|uniref:suppressor of lurcher protein 1-like isoform X1 n=1 Tax=Tachypleus tridentatus TaxID=6853 RepID=UPI003FD34E97